MNTFCSESYWPFKWFHHKIHADVCFSIGVILCNKLHIVDHLNIKLDPTHLKCKLHLGLTFSSDEGNMQSIYLMELNFLGSRSYQWRIIFLNIFISCSNSLSSRSELDIKNVKVVYIFLSPLSYILSVYGLYSLLNLTSYLKQTMRKIFLHQREHYFTMAKILKFPYLYGSTVFNVYSGIHIQLTRLCLYFFTLLFLGKLFLKNRLYMLYIKK